jgi:hypothetical protein
MKNTVKRKCKKAGLALAGILTVMSLSGCVFLNPAMLTGRAQVRVSYDRPPAYEVPCGKKVPEKPAKPRPVCVSKTFLNWNFRVDWQNY